MKQLASVLLVVALLAVSAPGRGAEPEYFVFVASESADRLSLLRFTAEGGRIVRETETGVMPTGVDGPQGLAVSPDGRFY